MLRACLPWFLGGALLWCGGAMRAAAAEVVITEILYHPGADNPGGEYLEIFNRGASPVDLGGWTLEAAVDFRFPEGLVLNSRSHLVVYEDAAAVGRYGIPAQRAVGPYAGQLSNAGDPIVLRDEAGNLVDDVVYDDQAPWPPEADGAGPSLELIDAGMDNSEPESWAAGQPYSPGLANSPAPPGGGPVAITEIMYRPLKRRLLVSLDPFWIDKGPYWETGDDPPGEYVELFNRSDAPVDLSGWKLVDGGGVLFQFPAGISLAPASYIVVCAVAAEVSRQYGIASTVGDFPPARHLSDGGERITLSDVAGSAIDTVRYGDGPPWPIAPDDGGASLECLDPAADNAGPENWRASQVPARPEPSSPKVGDEYALARGTPGEANSRSAEGVPPFIPLSALERSPVKPTSADEVKITVIPAGGGAFLDLTLKYDGYSAPYQSPAFSGSVALRDDGTGGDAVAGDGKYSATIPPLESQTLVRYWVVVRDALGRGWRYPDLAEPSPNKAYFPYDGEEDTLLPAYFLILPAASQAALDADIWSREYVEATLVAEGIVHDHVGVHYRGRGWRMHPKKSYKVAFNKTEHLRDLSHLDLAMHFPILQKLVHDIFWSMGHGNLGSEPVRLYRNGSFYGLMLAQESPDASWLRKHGMDPDGEIYKASAAPVFSSGGGWSGTYVADLRSFADATVYPKLYEKKVDDLGPFDALIELTRQVSDTREADIAGTLRDAVDLDGWLYRWAVHVAGGHADIVGSNFFVWRPAETDARWRLMYYDFDLFFGCKGLDFVDVACMPFNFDPYVYVNRFNKRVSVNPELRDRFLVILNDVLQHHMTVEKLGARVDAYIAATVQDRNDELAVGFGGPGPYVLSPPDPEEIKSFFAARRNWLLTTWLPSQGFEPPANEHPTIAVEAPSLQAQGILIQWTPHDPEGDPATVDLYWTDRKWTHLEPIPAAKDIPAGAGRFLWPNPDARVSESAFIHGVIRDSESDLEGHGESDPLTPPAPPTFSPPAGSVVTSSGLSLSSPGGAGQVYYTIDGRDPRGGDGGLSPGALAYLGPIEITAPTLVKARVKVAMGAGFWSDLAEGYFRVPAVTIAVTEIMYHPPEGNDLDFLEIHNYGTKAVDLRGMSLADGVTFDFAGGDVKTLEPLGYVVVVSNEAAFRTLHGDEGIQIAGAYEGILSDRGERLLLVDGAGETLVDFTFRASWYPETDGGGRSLVLADVHSLPETWGDPSSWRPSAQVNGSPGGPDGGFVVRFIRGDANADGTVDIADAVFSLSFQFTGGQGPECLESLDGNDSGVVDITDPIYILGFLFLGGPRPPAPYPACGSDGAPGGPGCESHAPCN